MPEIDRGALLVWSEEEWRERNERSLARNMRKSILAAVCSYSVMVAVIFIIVVAEIDPGEWLGLVPRIVLPALFVPAMIIIMDLITKQVQRRLPMVGLYEKGVELGSNIFLPYTEVAGMVQMKGWARLQPRYQRILPLGLRIPWRWIVDLDLMGEEGAAELEARVAGRPTGEEPPRLVLYGG